MAGPILPDVLGPGLRIVFCGSAAGAASARAGAYYAGPGNRFWPTLHRVGLTPHLLAPAAFRTVLDHGIGLTDLCKTESGADAGLSRRADDADCARRQDRLPPPGHPRLQRQARGAGLPRRRGPRLRGAGDAHRGRPRSTCCRRPPAPPGAGGTRASGTARRRPRGVRAGRAAHETAGARPGRVGTHPVLCRGGLRLLPAGALDRADRVQEPARHPHLDTGLHADAGELRQRLLARALRGRRAAGDRLRPLLRQQHRDLGRERGPRADPRHRRGLRLLALAAQGQRQLPAGDPDRADAAAYRPHHPALRALPHDRAGGQPPRHHPCSTPPSTCPSPSG